MGSAKNTVKKKTAIISVRVSTPGQKERDTIQAQVTLCKRLKEQHDVDLLPYGPNKDGWLIDDGISGSLLEGRKFGKLIDDLEQGRVAPDFVIAPNLNRLARPDWKGKDRRKRIKSQMEEARIYAVLDAAGVKIIDSEGINEPLSLMTAIKRTLSGAEYADIRDKTVRGKHEKLDEGRYCTGGRVPYGYERVFRNGKNRNDGTTLAPHPVDGPRAKKLLAEWFVKGGKSYAARKAQEAGWPTPRANATWTKKPKRKPTAWYASTIQQILNNLPAYLGSRNLSIEGKAYEVDYAPLFTLTEYGAILRRQKETSLPHRTTLLTSGYVDCGVCGGHIHGSRSSTRDHFHITCRKRCTRMREDVFSRALWEVVVARLVALAEQARSIGNKSANAAQINEAKEKLKTVQGKLDRLAEAFADGNMDKTALINASKKLKDEKASIQVEIDRLVREREAKATKTVTEESVHARVQAILRRLKTGRLTLGERRKILADLLNGERVVLVRQGGKKGTPVITMPAFGPLPSVTVRLDQDVTSQIKGVSREMLDVLYEVDDVVEDVAI